jgi:hypothetical protein
MADPTPTVHAAPGDDFHVLIIGAGTILRILASDKAQGSC